jgi:hypothetical protein
MDSMKKIFNKKKTNNTQTGKLEKVDTVYSEGNQATDSIPATTTTLSSSSPSTPQPNPPFTSSSAFIDYDNNNNTDSHTISKSFQYSYNSNTNSLFSSKRTLSTNVSSQPSSNLSYSKNINNEQAKITSKGRPLRVLHEDEHEENYSIQNVSSFKKDDQSISIDENSNNFIPPSSSPQMLTKSLSTSSNRVNSITRKKSNYSDDIPLSLTEKSNQSSSNENNLNMSKLSNNENDLLLQLQDFIKGQLRILANSISNIMIQISQSVLNLTKASIKITESMDHIYKVIKSTKYLNLLIPNQLTTSNSVGLKKLVKNILHLLDNLLIGTVYNKSKALIVKNLHDLFVLIKVIPNNTLELTNFVTEMSPEIFPIGSSNQEIANIEKVDYLMKSLLSKDKGNLFSDQDGSFVAPVLRGFYSPSLSVITFIFGFPEISREHQDIIKFFSAQSSDTHFTVQKNKIKYSSFNNSNEGIKLKSPFRTIDKNQEYIPISMSLSTDNSIMTSGTLGGYIYPKVPINCINPKLLKYRGQIFGLTCAHVVLNNNDKNDDNLHPNVSIPSPVLINLYKNALLNEMMNHSKTSVEYQVYNEAVKMIDFEYPMKKIIINGKETNRNLPSDNLGNIIWGERLINENRLSDLAIIKVSENLKKKFINYLGEDLQLSQYDPSLILSNLNVKRIVSLQPRKNGLLNTANLNVFKIGSTTGYTRGKLNGIKMIYWSDGSLRSSEFIISNGDGKMEGFANGGDSGAWILSKLSDVNNIKSSFKEEEFEDEESNNIEEDDNNKNSLTAFIESFIPRVNNNNNNNNNINDTKKNNKKKKNLKNKDKTINEESGLGVLGMLHSYDGEYKQFGLFTPIEDILDRLETVTGVEWGIVGCSENGDTETISTTSISSGNSITSDKEYSEDDI